MARHKDDVKTVVLNIRLNREQFKLVGARAEKCRMPTSTWVRAIVLQAASKPARKGGMRIQEPDGTQI